MNRIVSYKTSWKDKIEWTIEAEPEDIPVRGNAMDSGDKDYDKKVEDRIIKRRSSNVWAWAAVTVRGSFLGLSTEEYLGGCSYRNEQDFRDGGYFEDMQRTITDRLEEMVKAIVTAYGEEERKSYAQA